ncbi:hypothetical protein D3C76_1089510 [compost metagenome]
MASANTLRTVDQPERNDWEVVPRLHGLTFFIPRLKDQVIMLVQVFAHVRARPGVDVTHRRRFSAHDRAELPNRCEEVDVVGTREVLRQAYDSVTQRFLTVLIGCDFRAV